MTTMIRVLYDWPCRVLQQQMLARCARAPRVFALLALGVCARSSANNNTNNRTASKTKHSWSASAASETEMPFTVNATVLSVILLQVVSTKSVLGRGVSTTSKYSHDNGDSRTLRPALSGPKSNGLRGPYYSCRHTTITFTDACKTDPFVLISEHMTNIVYS